MTLTPTMPVEQEPRTKTASSHKDYLDVARVTATIAVIVIHLTSSPSSRGHGSSAWIVTALNTACRCAVPLFIMISGALLLDPSRRIAPSEFYRRRLPRILVPLLFWSIFYLCWRRFYEHERLSVFSAVREFAFGRPYYHLYFLFLIAGLYMITPVLHTFVRVESATRQLGAGIIALMWTATAATLAVLFRQHNDPLALTLFTSCVGYYLMGYVMDSHAMPERWLRWAPVIFIGALAISAGGVSVIHHIGKFQRLQPLLSRYTGPCVILVTLAAFSLFKSLRPATHPLVASAIRVISPASFGIYLVHPLVIALFERFHISWIRPNAIIAVPIWSAMVLIVSLLVTRAVQLIPGVRMVVG